MAVVLVCSSCQRATTIRDEHLPATCPNCGAEYPPSAVEAVRATLAAEIPQRPAGVTLGAAFSTFWGGVALFIALVSVVGSGPYRVNGEIVSKSDFLASPMFLWVPFGAAYALAIAYTVFTERYPARRLMVGAWLLLMVSYFALPSTSEAQRFFNVGATGICFAIALWYLYRKPNVRRYFEHIEGQHSSAPRS